MRATHDGHGVDYAVVGPAGGVPILLTHSLGTDRSMWDPQVEALGGKHRLVLVDTLGHGSSDVPPGPYTIDQLATLVLAAADAEEIDQFAVCGVSMGGQIALWLAIHHPSRVLAMVASNTAARVGSADGWAVRVAAIRQRGMEDMATEIVPRFVSPEFRRRDPAGWDHLIETFVGTDPEGYIGCCEALGAADLADAVGGITVPSLIIGGSEDVSTPPGQAEELHAAIRHSQLEIIAGAAHLSNLDAPEVFTRRVEEFLDCV
jgi:3-oxoadipate enol-lactonase